jgi:hypothetical protein
MNIPCFTRSAPSTESKIPANIRAINQPTEITTITHQTRRLKCLKPEFFCHTGYEKVSTNWIATWCFSGGAIASKNHEPRILSK